MKNLIIIFALLSVNFSFAQNINWSSINEDQNNLAYLNFGYDFGLTTQVGYGYHLDSNRPILLTVDYSSPMGNDLVDDFKIRLGSQISIYEKNQFMFSAKAYGIFRRHQTKLITMQSFGSELAAIFGYYKSSWHIASEFGFDKSITTHLKQSDIMKENYPSIAGATKAQAKDENSILPYYAQLGLSFKF